MLSQPREFWSSFLDVTLPSMPLLPITSPETIRKCHELNPVGDKDIFICSYPKSGTTWMQNIVYQLLVATQSLKKALPPLQHISDYAPFFEIDPHWKDDCDENTDAIQQAHEVLGYRMFNTHLRYDMMPRSTDNLYRAIYVVRDGRDVCTSFYHHMVNQHVDDGGFPTDDFDEFFQAFLNGEATFGKWTHHLASWLPQYYDQQEQDETKNENDTTPNKPTTIPKCRILLVRYEDLKQNLNKELQRVAEFLQLTPLLEQPHDGAVWQSILEKVSFSYMRQHQSLFHPRSVRWKEGYNFIRKGTVGDHATLWSEQHCQEFDARTQKDLKELL